MIQLLLFYRRWISPLLPPRCRFVPSCSAYAIEAIQTHGNIKGGWLAVRRLVRCHPLCKAGYDPVPKGCHEKSDRTTPVTTQSQLPTDHQSTELNSR